MLALAFLNPLLLWGLPLAAVPIVIHLLNRRRFQRVPWAAMEYLLAAMKRNRKRMRMEQWLVLLLRTLAVLLLISLVARPQLTGSGLIGARAHHVVLLDDSASMWQRSGSTTLHDKAREQIRQLADYLSINRGGDLFSLVRTSRPGSPDLYPPAQRREIEAVGALVFSTVNNGVYKAGMAATQAQYEEAFDALFTTLAALEERLSRRRFLLGDQPTEADIRLYPTLARFDAVYYLHFKCNLRRLVDYQSLWGYARDLFQRPGFGETTDFGQIKRHYYQSQAWINPSRIVPKGPFVSWLEPHGRDRLSG